MEESIQKYELQQDNNIYILTTSIINNENLKLICFPPKQKFGYQNQFSLNDLIKINQIFTYYKTIKEVQYELEKCILEQKVSLIHNRTIFDIIFVITKNSNITKASLRLNYQGFQGSSVKERKTINQNILNQIEKDTSTILKEQSLLKAQIDQILSSNFIINSISNNLINNNVNKNNNNNTFKNDINNNSYNFTDNNIDKEPKNNMKRNKMKKLDKIFEGEHSNILKTIDEYNILEKQFKNKNKFIKNIKFKLLYKASRDSDKAEIFHKKCNGIKNTIIFVKTDKNKRFGGFTTQTWDWDEKEKIDKNAFIFSLDNLKIYDIKPRFNAIGCFQNYGPIFSGYQILIYDNAFVKGGTTYLKGINYNTEEDYELSGGFKKYGILEIEVFNVIFE